MAKTEESEWILEGGYSSFHLRMPHLVLVSKQKDSLELFECKGKQWELARKEKLGERAEKVLGKEGALVYVDEYKFICHFITIH